MAHAWKHERDIITSSLKMAMEEFCTAAEGIAESFDDRGGEALYDIHAGKLLLDII